MRRLLLVVYVLVSAMPVGAAVQGKITVDPNAPGAPVAREARLEDPRLDQKITYRVKLRPMADLTDDLSKLTGVTFHAGITSRDWRVREDCCTVMARDITLRRLMDSIAHVMKFRWSRAGKEPNWTYRLVEDKSALAKVLREEQARKDRDRAARVARLDRLRSVSGMSPEEFAKLREEDPELYLLAKNGLLGPVLALFDQAPAVRDAWIDGEDLRVNASWLPATARNAAKSYYRAAVTVVAEGAEGIDMAEVVRQLDDHSDLIKVEVNKPQTWMPYGSLTVNMYMLGPMDVTMEPPRTEADRLRAKVSLRAAEEKRPFPDVYREMKDDIQAARKKERENAPPVLRSYTQEAPLDHSKDPDFGEPLNDKIDVKTVTGMIELVADATGLAIVTDDFRGRLNTSLPKGRTMNDLFSGIASMEGGHNWRKTGDVIEIWDLSWYDKRSARISKVWLEELRRKFKSNGTLDLDDLSQIASLTDPQLYGNIARDKVLRPVYLEISQKRDYLKTYASLTVPQRSMLSSDFGLSFASLTPQQQQAAIKFLAGIEAPQLQTLDLASLEPRITLARERHRNGVSITYTLRAFTNLGQIPGQSRFTTPPYVAPPGTETQPAPGVPRKAGHP